MWDSNRVSWVRSVILYHLSWTHRSYLHHILFYWLFSGIFLSYFLVFCLLNIRSDNAIIRKLLSECSTDARLLPNKCRWLWRRRFLVATTSLRCWWLSWWAPLWCLESEKGSLNGFRKSICSAFEKHKLAPFRLKSKYSRQVHFWNSNYSSIFWSRIWTHNVTMLLTRLVMEFILILIENYYTL